MPLRASRSRTCPPARAFHDVITLWLGALSATRRWRVTPLPVGKDPPAYSLVPSPEKGRARTPPLAETSPSRLRVGAWPGAIPPTPSSFPPRYTTPPRLMLLCTGPAGCHGSEIGCSLYAACAGAAKASTV